MTVYYYDLFTGTAGTLLTSHTADSGATWPDDADHYYGTGIVTLDGLGGVYQSNTSSSNTINLSSAAMPSTQNFKVLFSYIRKTSIAANAGLIFLSSSWPTIADSYELFYAEGEGWLLYHTSITGSTNTLLAGPYAGPALGVTWYMKVDVSTSGGNTTFTAYWSTAGTGPFTQLFSYTAATSPDLVAVGTWFHNPSTASTATTGQHIGALTVQSIPALSSATLSGPTQPDVTRHAGVRDSALSSATLSGPTQQLFSTPAEFTVGLNEPAGSGGIVVTLSSSNSSDTFQTTQGEANVTTITIPSGSESGTFWLTPGGTTGSRTITITTSPTPNYSGSPFTYNAMTTATGYTVTGASGGHQLVPVTWTITLVGGTFAGTITATPGGGVGQCQIFSTSMTPWNGTQSSQTFMFTPLDQDSVTYTFTNSGSLTNPSPVTFTATRVYYQDTFVGTAGTSIASWTSNTLPGLSGSKYTVAGTGTIELDGSTTDNGTGMCYLATSGDTYAITKAVLPTWPRSASVEILFDIIQLSSDPGGYGGVVLLLDTSPDIVYFMLTPNHFNRMGMFQNGSLNNNCYTSYLQPVNQLWTVKLDITVYNQYSSFSAWYSTDGGATFTAMFSGYYDTDAIPSIIAVGPYFQGDVGGPTTGVHIGNIIVQDPAPAPPNCSISKAYVTTSGQSVAFFFETGLTGTGGSALTPTAMNYAPSFFRNGTSIGVGTNAWVTGYHSCAIVQLQPGVQINPGDTVTVTTPASWMTCGTGNAANQVIDFALTNLAGKSCFGTESLVKTFRPGFNIDDLGPWDSAYYNIPVNFRYNLGWFGGSSTPDGAPITVAGDPAAAQFYYPGQSTGGNYIDNTGVPGIPGYWMVMWDDLYLSHSGAVQTSLSLGPQWWGLDSYVNVTQDSTCISVANPGTIEPGVGIIGQAQMFNVQVPSGSSSCSLPLALLLSNANNTPFISNLWIVAPGDFSYTPGTPLTFDRSNPYLISNTWKQRFANGAGVLRWGGATIGFMSWTNLSEAWEQHQLTDFSWNNAGYSNNTIGYSEFRALDLSVSPYVYSDFNGLVGSPYNLTLNTGVGATDTTFSVNAGSGDAWEIPISGLLLVMGSGEKCRIKLATLVSGTTYDCIVERGSSGTTAASQSAGTIACLARLAITSYSQIGSQVFEVVTSGCSYSTPGISYNGPNHNLKTGIRPGFSNGTYPGTMYYTDGSAGYGVQYYAFNCMVTGPTTFAVQQGNSSPCTIGPSSTYPNAPTSYALTLCNGNSSCPGTGYPHEFVAIVTGSLPGCNIYINIPPVASDSYAYDVATKIKNYFPAGRKVYVELSDEFWNFSQDAIKLTALYSNLYGYNNLFEWYIIRTGQLRTIFRNVFGSRASEVQVVINSQISVPENGAGMLSLAIANDVIIDAYATAPYINADASIASTNAWNNSKTVAQMVDLWIHDVYYNNQFWVPTTNAHLSNIATYNASALMRSAGITCYLSAYEGGYSNLNVSVNNNGNLARDLACHPNWRIIEQDWYALCQTTGWKEFAIEDYCSYPGAPANWPYYHWAQQPFGRGDGSDGKANNLLWFCTPGFIVNYAPTITNTQDLNTVSVRGQAFLDWMQPAKDKKKMLFAPYR